MRAMTRGVGLDHVIVAAAANSPEPLLLALEAARDRGSVVVLGDVPPQMPREPLYRKELSFRVSRSYGPGRYDRNFEERGPRLPDRLRPLDRTAQHGGRARSLARERLR